MPETFTGEVELEDCEDFFFIMLDNPNLIITGESA